MPVRPEDVATWMVRHGFAVHPLAPGAKTPAPNCGACATGTHPAQQCPCHARRGWCHGFHAATTDLDTVRQWWAAQPRFGVGVACGPSRLVVIDVDAHTDRPPERSRLLPGIPVHDSVDLTGLGSGFDTLALLAAHRRRPDPCADTSTLRVRTPSGGMHVWYRAPRHAPAFKSSSGSGHRTALAWQVDVRAANGYIVAPGTRTTAGDYRALPGARTPAPLPLWLTAELTRTGHRADPPPPPSPSATASPTPTSSPRPESAPRVLAALLRDVEACGAVPEGAAFSEKLNRAAFTAGGLVRGGHLGDAETRRLLLETATRARPHQLRRNAHIVETGMRAGSARPIRPEERT
ncbi:bifunctional DNA primase/polymerase [Streptomyces sp. bgisy126]|uniref:bifunctional DNA primase/polymerase n=1 Tax=unclassified Streptomyces TaxID=2593676 RepID=UPI003EBE5FAC